MFSARNLKSDPFISKELDYPHTFVPPPIEQTSCSDWLLLSIINGRIDKIYGWRILPLHDMIAMKIKYVDEDFPQSEIIQRPEFNLLRKIWECGNKGFNSGILHYVYYSKHCVLQYRDKKKFPSNSVEDNLWYYNLITT